MKTKCIRKISSIFIFLCIIMTVFTCLAGISVSADTSDLVTFDGTNSYGCFIYTSSWTDIAAGNYKFEMDCKITSGTPMVYPTARAVNQSPQNGYYTNRVYNYDSTNYKYTVTFTVSTDYSGNYSMYIGNYGGEYGDTGDAAFACANPSLYLLDGDGNPTGSNLVNTFSSGYYSSEKDVNTNSVNKWRRRNSGWSCGSIPSGYFDPQADPGEAVNQMIHFPARCADNYQVLCYKGGAISAGVYRFTVDECAVGGIKSAVLINVNSGSATSGFTGSMEIESGTKDILSGNKRTVYFRLWGNKTSFIVMIGNRGKGIAMDTYYKDPQLVKIEDGNPTGDNLIANFTTDNIVLKTGTTKDNIATGKWTSINWSNGYITYDDIDNDKFNPVYRDGDYTDNGTTDIYDLVNYKNVRCGNKVTLQSLDCDENGTVEDADFMELVDTILGKKTYTLQNTLHKLTAGDTVNVAYIGGSVTGGTGSTDSSQYSWRARTTAWLSSKYPNATVNEINMGIGGTGSYLGAARFNNNIISRNPDLVFVEFAVNDTYNDISTVQTKQDIEYMIRSLNDNHPYCDMVFVMVTDRYKLGTQFTKLLEIKEVADYYGIPIIDVGVAMSETLGGSTANWDTYYGDMVHPNDDGYAVYANAIMSGLENLMVSGNYSKHKLKNIKLSLYTPDYVSLLTRDTFDPFKWGKLDSDWGANYWFNNTDYEISGTPFRTSYSSCLSEIFSKYIYPLSDGADLTFTVKGTSIGILGNIKANQTLTVNIDGTDYVLSGSNSTSMTEYPVANDLADVNHTVTITANGSGPYIAIAAVVVGS